VFSQGYEITARNSNTSITIDTPVRINNEYYKIQYHEENGPESMGDISGWRWYDGTNDLELFTDVDIPLSNAEITYLNNNNLWSTWVEITLENVITGGTTEKFYPTAYDKNTLIFTVTKNLNGVDVTEVNSGPMSMKWYGLPQFYTTGTVTAGYTYQTSGSIEIARIAASGSSGQDKPFISLGQATQSYSQEGIYIGYDNASGDYPVLSMVGGSGNYIQWDGQDLELSGTVNAAAGNIGGFGIFSNAISSSVHVTSGSVTPVTLPKLSLKANGEITGSEALFVRKIGDDFYSIIDTTAGIIDARNNGRQIVSDYTEYEWTGSVETKVAEYYFQLMPGENRILYAFSQLAHRQSSGLTGGYISGTCKMTLQIPNTGSVTNGPFGYSTSTDGTFYYDGFSGRPEYTVFEKTLGNISTDDYYSSRTNQPGDGSFYYEVPEVLQGRLIRANVYLKTLNVGTTGTRTAGTYSRVKGMSLVATRTFGQATGDITETLNQFGGPTPL
jgi:hypothetical protein